MKNTIWCSNYCTKAPYKTSWQKTLPLNNNILYIIIYYSEVVSDAISLTSLNSLNLFTFPSFSQLFNMVLNQLIPPHFIIAIVCRLLFLKRWENDSGMLLLFVNADLIDRSHIRYTNLVAWCSIMLMVSTCSNFATLELCVPQWYKLRPL